MRRSAIVVEASEVEPATREMRMICAQHRVSLPANETCLFAEKSGGTSDYEDVLDVHFCT